MKSTFLFFWIQVDKQERISLGSERLRERADAVIESALEALLSLLQGGFARLKKVTEPLLSLIAELFRGNV